MQSVYPYFPACNYHPNLKTQMSGPSMWPTLGNSGEWVIENRISYLLRPNSIARGDLVTVSSPQNPRRIICKRVIGLPGDVICVDPTGVKAPSTEHVIVPKGHVWISGDNAKLSIDSRDYGPVSMALVRGKLSARVSKYLSRYVRTAHSYLAMIDLAFEQIDDI